MTTFILLLLLIGVVILDLKCIFSVVSLYHSWYTLFLLPHFYLFTVILQTYLTTFMFIVLSLYGGYCLLRMHVFPVLKDNSGQLRLKIMIGGRKILLLGMTTIIIQSVLYAVLFGYFKNIRIDNSVLIIDGLITLVFVLLLLWNGLFRILLTSKRLGLIKRVIFLCTWWIPIINIVVFCYIARLVKWEYDHECYKVVKNDARIDSQICATKYPLLLVHGIGFRDLKYLNYWGRIPKELIRNGAKVYYGHQEAWGTIEDNAAAIREKILEILAENHCEKVNLIAHSKGGLDARYMIDHDQMAAHVATLTTISTPHKGSQLVDVLCKLPDHVYRNITKLIDKYFQKLGDKKPDSYVSSRQLAPAYAATFNQNIHNVNGVYYQSYATVMKNFSSDFLLAIPYSILKFMNGDNDGLVCVDSAKWGEFKGVLANRYRKGTSHGDIIDLKRADYRGFDVSEEFVKIVAELQEKGY